LCESAAIVNTGNIFEQPWNSILPRLYWRLFFSVNEHS
jgi:hypothetical protein